VPNVRETLPQDFQANVESVSRIEAVPTLFDVVCRTTGRRFAAVARVTEDRWIACGVLDEIDFGLKPGWLMKLEQQKVVTGGIIEGSVQQLALVRRNRQAHSQARWRRRDITDASGGVIEKTKGPWLS
jgi:hypothetical protein